MQWDPYGVQTHRWAAPVYNQVPKVARPVIVKEERTYKSWGVCL